MSSDEINLPVVAVAAATTALTKEAYGDVLKPSASILGEHLAMPLRLIRAAFFPLQKLLLEAEHRQQEWLENDLGKRLEAIPDDRLMEAPPQLLASVLERVPLFSDESELRAMFARLLAASMDSELSGGVHRSYAHIIEQITPAEARILSAVIDSTYLAIATGEGDAPDLADNDLMNSFFRICESANIVDNGIVRNAFDNLLRLRIFRIDRTSSSRVVSASDMDASFYLDSGLKTSHEVMLSFSDYGSGFVATCVTEHHISAPE